MAKGILTMANFAFREAMRKKALLAAVVLTVLYLAVFGYGVSQLTRVHGGGMDRAFSQLMVTQIFTMGLYLASLLTTLLAAFAAVGAISGELETGTAYALLTRPIPRAHILLGKFLGYGVMLAIYAGLFFLALWGILRWQGGAAPTGIWQPLGLFILQPLVMLAVTLLGSTLFSTLGNGIVMFMLYGLAMVGGFLEQIGAMAAIGNFGNLNSTALVNIGIISSLILPVDAIYRRTAFLLQAGSGDLWNAFNNIGPFGSVSIPSVWMVVYGVVYLVGCLILAVRVFNRKDI